MKDSQPVPLPPPQKAASTLHGFGMRFDIPTGRVRNWYMKKGDVMRLADNDEPVEEGAA